MSIDIYAPTPSDALSPEELTLYHLIMDYRASLGLPAIPLSDGLTATAGRHAIDWIENIWRDGLTLPDGANLHSWSDAPYFPDHRSPDIMWEAPQRLGTSYPDTGYEISAAGYGDVAAALEGWQNSPGHNRVITNTDVWAPFEWSAIGVGVESDPSAGGPYGGRIYHVWFGEEPDPAGPPLIRGTGANETLEGTLFQDDMQAGAGSDRLLGSDGDDTLGGGRGNDFLRGDRGNDRVFGGLGNDSIFAGRDDEGNDTLSGGAGDDVVGAGAGDDSVRITEGADVLYGGPGDDLLYQDGSDPTGLGDVAWAGSGMDDVSLGGGDDVAGGGTGADVLFGGAGGDVFYGGPDGGNDTIDGGAGADIVYAGRGDDSISGGTGNDTLFNGPGNDTVEGGGGKDVIYGSPGNDVLFGGGRAGEDGGADTFRFVTGSGNDTVMDFNVASDRIATATGFDGTTISGNADGDAVLTFSDTTVTFVGVSAGQLDDPSLFIT